jgi:hypothetical protein
MQSIQNRSISSPEYRDIPIRNSSNRPRILASATIRRAWRSLRKASARTEFLSRWWSAASATSSRSSPNRAASATRSWRAGMPYPLESSS